MLVARVVIDGRPRPVFRPIAVPLLLVAEQAAQPLLILTRRSSRKSATLASDTDVMRTDKSLLPSSGWMNPWPLSSF
jgi:hypothetical protein